MTSLSTLRISAIAAVAAAGLALGGCTVGPDYHGAPTVAHADTFKRAPQGIVSTGPGVAAWWVALNDPELNALIDDAIKNSPDLHAAEARVRESRAGLQHAKSNGAPKLSADAAMVRMREPNLSSLEGGSSSGGQGPVDLFLTGFDASWELDLFGGTRRAVEAASAEADASQADLADAHVQLAAEIGNAYVGLRDQQQRVAIARKTVDIEQRVLTLTEQRRDRGVASELDVERVRTQVENTRASIIPLDAQIDESLDELAVLTGHEPGALDAQLSGAAPLPTLPATIAVGDPAQLLRQRPDVRAAERHLASQNAQIGEHVADYFPKVSLMGGLSFTAANPGHLLRKQNFTWFGVPYLQWNAFDFGRTKANVDQAKAGLDEAQAKYRSTVLGALKDADVALSRYGHERENDMSLRKVEASATHAATLTEQRYQAGTATALDWLDAERTRYSAEQTRIQSDAQLIKNYVGLQKSLGLGWQDPAQETAQVSSGASAGGSAQ
ncbi:TolC family protein [Paraburkholderia sp.]|uniref:efflux transporter outer membrane subunit n=1 Tax=Paraburkholderia sp. TaxID=1926495 RepID=UPI002395F731|nr:TolC family protein [Paraburkholderia sp.]MDE1181842.1 TolC family protein [Paraburkholderia sp.]